MSEEEATINVRDLAQRLSIDVTGIYVSTAQKVFITTEDKLELWSERYLKYVGKRSAWATPLGILLTIIVTFMTTTFKDFLAVKASTWEAVFIIAGFLAFLWFLWSVYQAFKATKVDIVKELKTQEITMTISNNGNIYENLKA